MIDRMFGNTDLLQKGLDAAWLRNDVISNNIANADTPNFKSSSVAFESLFKSALENEQNDSGFEAKRTRDKHISFTPDTPDISEVSAVVSKNEDSSLRMDGNNVDVEAENVALAKNTIYYYMLTEQINSEFSRLSMAIKEGK